MVKEGRVEYIPLISVARMFAATTNNKGAGENVQARSEAGFYRAI
jgi:hypothetical protein